MAPSQFGWISSSAVSDQSFEPADASGVIKAKFNYRVEVFSDSLQFYYKPSSVSTLQVVFKLWLISVKSMELVVGSNSCTLTFSDTRANITAAELSFTLPGLTVNSVDRSGDDTVVSA